MRFLSGLASVAALIFGVEPALGASYTETVNFPGPGSTVGQANFIDRTGTTAGPGGNQFYFFDARGGVLTSITFTYSYAFSSSINVSSVTPSSGTVRTESGAQFSADDSLVTAALNRAVNTDSAGVTFGRTTLTPVFADILGNNSPYAFTGAAGGNATYTSQGSASNSLVDTSATDLAAFSRMGGSFTPFFNTLTGLVSMSSGGNAQLSQSTVATSSLTITYTYSEILAPLPSVPEPVTWASLVLGTGIIGGLMRCCRNGAVNVAALPDDRRRSR